MVVGERTYLEFDAPQFYELHVRSAPPALRSIDLYLSGIRCAGCVARVEKLPLTMRGVVSVRLDMGRSVARIQWDDRHHKLSEVAQALHQMGYPVRPFRGAELHQHRMEEDRALLLRIGIAGAVAGNVMMLAFALYGGMFSDMAAEYARLLRWISLILAVPAVLWAGGDFFRGAVSVFRTRTLHMDLPVAVALMAGLLWGARNTILDTGDVYFETITVLVFLLLCGRWIQRRQQRKAAQAAELLFSVTPSGARRVEPEGVREVPIEALESGDLIEVRPGEVIATDGTVESGNSALDLGVLTGESVPVDVGGGDEVYAGTTNLASLLRIRVVATGEETRVGRLMQMVEEQSARRAPLVRIADRLAGWFVGGVTALAGLTVAIWWHVDPSTAVENAVALLIVACPCALGLATPLAVSVAIGRAARQGILIKGGDALEALARPGVVFLDKTGTLTRGRITLVRWLGDETVRPLVAALEEASTHPVGRALFCGTNRDEGRVCADSPPEHVLGGGVEGAVLGRRVRVGSPRWIGADEHPDVARMTEDALTPVVVEVDGAVVAVAGLGDTLRSDAAQTVNQLLAMGWEVQILSGDHPNVVAQIGKGLGLPADVCRGGVSPEEKLAVVIGAGPERRTVVMVGDGVNDAAALAAATVGMAVHGGAETSLMAADVFASRPGMAPLAALLVAARRTVRVIYRNLAFSLVYNLVGVSLAITGVINPLIAAILMPISSLTVITSSWRARTFDVPEAAPIRGRQP